jgi:hypothetical protein
METRVKQNIETLCLENNFVSKAIKQYRKTRITIFSIFLGLCTSNAYSANKCINVLANPKPAIAMEKAVVIAEFLTKETGSNSRLQVFKSKPIYSDNSKNLEIAITNSVRGKYIELRVLFKLEQGLSFPDVMNQASKKVEEVAVAMEALSIADDEVAYISENPIIQERTHENAIISGQSVFIKSGDSNIETANRIRSLLEFKTKPDTKIEISNDTVNEISGWLKTDLDISPGIIRSRYIIPALKKDPGLKLLNEEDFKVLADRLMNITDFTLPLDTKVREVIIAFIEEK